MVPIDLQIAFGVQFGLGNAFSAAFHSKTPPILEPKFNQNQSGSNQKSKKSIIEVDVIFLKIFIEILIDFDARIDWIVNQFET